MQSVSQSINRDNFKLQERAFLRLLGRLHHRQAFTGADRRMHRAGDTGNFAGARRLHRKLHLSVKNGHARSEKGGVTGLEK